MFKSSRTEKHKTDQYGKIFQFYLFYIKKIGAELKINTITEKENLVS